MAVVSKDISARLRLTDSKMKTVASYSGIRPDAVAAEIKEFTGALEMLRGKSFGFQYLTVESELEDTI